MNKEILLIESVIRVPDHNQPHVRCVETNFGLVKALGPDDYVPEDYSTIQANVVDFAYFDKGDVKRFRLAWHPEFEKELGISFDVISGQSNEIEKLRWERATLKIKLDTVINMSFVKRVKFLFGGGVE